jgi:TonB family protein
MRQRIVLAMLVIAAIAGTGVATRAWAQAADERPADLVPIWLPRPQYPVIAHAARLQGEAEVAVEVDADGNVSSAVMRSGHALFRDAVLEAARETHFLTRPAGAPVLPYSLSYMFALGDGAPLPQQLSAITPAGARTTTVTDVQTVSCGPGPLAVPGPKCLYLWRCGRDWNWSR